MKRMMAVAAMASALALSACGDDAGGGTSHAACVDDASSVAYVEKFATDVSQAVLDRKITPEQAAAAGEKMRAANNEANGENGKGSAWYCTQLDAIRAELKL
ncbi:MAG TPA: hypothetical protein PL096_02035 [Micropepsaceae bacterium]|nr:hypothetical protein [Micropepsaceae bacterium]